MLFIFFTDLKVLTQSLSLIFIKVSTYQCSSLASYSDLDKKEDCLEVPDDECTQMDWATEKLHERSDQVSVPELKRTKSIIVCVLFQCFCFIAQQKRPTSNFTHFLMQMKNGPFEFSDALFDLSEDCPERFFISQPSKRPRREASHSVSIRNMMLGQSIATHVHM